MKVTYTLTDIELQHIIRSYLCGLLPPGIVKGDWKFGNYTMLPYELEISVTPREESAS